MHAVVVEEFGDPSVLRFREWPEPKPRPDEIAMRVALTGVNFTDTLYRTGKMGAKPPYIPGRDGVGIVTAVGADVQGFRVGERVAAFIDEGSYTQVALAKASLAYPVPDGVSDEEAASLVVLVTAWNALRYAGRLTAGETVLVHAGAGGVGSSAIQFARAFGAAKIIATVGDLAKASYAEECGADLVLDAKAFADGVRAATGGQGADVILDGVGGPLTAMSIDVLAPFGRYVNFGHASGAAGQALTTKLQGVHRSVIGYSTGYYRAHRHAALRPAVDQVFRAVLDRKVRLLTAKTLPLREAAQAHRLIEARQNHGKIMLKP